MHNYESMQAAFELNGNNKTISDDDGETCQKLKMEARKLAWCFLYEVDWDETEIFFQFQRPLLFQLVPDNIELFVCVFTHEATDVVFCVQAPAAKWN